MRGLASAGFEAAVAAASSARPAPAHWSRAASERISVPHPLLDEPGFVAAIGRAARSGRYAALIPGSDASLLALSAARDGLALHLLLGLPPHDVVLRSLDKIALASAASRHGLASPPTRVCTGVADAIATAREHGFPVVVKPICSIIERDGGRYQFGGVRVGDTAGLVRAVTESGGRCLVQRVESGPVLSLAGVFAGGRLLGEALSRYRRTWYPDAGNVSFSETIDSQPELTARVSGLLTEIGWEGLFELEVIERGPQDWAAIDCNPRPFGSLALAIAAGANLPAVWCSHLLGGHPSPVRALPGHYYRWEDADLRHALWQLRHGRFKAATQVARVRRHVAHPYLQARDPGPFLARLVFLARSGRDGRRRVVAPGAVTQDVRDPVTPRRRRRGAGNRGRVIVVGAGPYGLSAMAHLRAAGLDVRGFGRPLDFWRHNMPAGMILRSPRRATDIADPHHELTIDRYERSEGKAVRASSLLLEEFVDYGLWFQRHAMPDLDQRMVHSIGRRNGDFCLRLDDGAELQASRVVVAAGLAPCAAWPEPFASLPSQFVSHASEHHDLSFLSGRRVLVIGAGQSALESAALLSEHGATVEVLARAGAVNWLGDHTPPATGRRRPTFPIPPPPTGVGGRLTGWIAAMPDLFARLPAAAKPWVSSRCTRPAGSGWLRARLAAVTISCARAVAEAQAREGSLWLRLDDGSERIVDHVLLGTGYQVDVSRYAFLGRELSAELDIVAGYPRLGPGLESSVPGLHFLGAPAAYSFGPIMRFVVGTWYAAPALTLAALERTQRPIRFAF